MKAGDRHARSNVLANVDKYDGREHEGKLFHRSTVPCIKSTRNDAKISSMGEGGGEDMQSRRPSSRRRAVSVLLTAGVLALTACSPKAPQPPPSQTPFPVPKTSGPKPSPTPTASLDRDVHDAVEAYYVGYDEVNRITSKGGALKPTKLMKSTMSGDYLNLMTAVIQPGSFTKGTAQIDGYSVGARTARTIRITGCENESKIKVFNSKTRKIEPPSSPKYTGLIARQVLAVKAADGHWRVDRILHEQDVRPKDWETQACMAVTERPS